jgi:four helix bundle protein
MGIGFLRFEDMKAWRIADELTLEIYKILRPITDYGYKDQIQRAAVSIMNNIAEVFERNSKKAFTSHLYIAKGSCGEVRSMLILGFQLGYFTEAQHQRLTLQAVEISKMLFGLIRELFNSL